MPALQRVWFHHNQGFSPTLDPTRQQHQDAPVMRRQLGAANLPFQHDQSLPQQYVFGDEFGLAAVQIRQRAMG